MSADEIINDYLKFKLNMLESQILQKGELLRFFLDLQKNNDSQFAVDQIAMLTTDLDELIKELLALRRDSDLLNPATQGVIDIMGNIKPISRETLLKNLKSKYQWQG